MVEKLRQKPSSRDGAQIEFWACPPNMGFMGSFLRCLVASQPQTAHSRGSSGNKSQLSTCGGGEGRESSGCSSWEETGNHHSSSDHLPLPLTPRLLEAVSKRLAVLENRVI